MKAVKKTDDYVDKVRRRKKSITDRNLLIAAREGDEDLINTCIKEGADINFVDREGGTPLHYAVRSEKVEVVKLFVNGVADVNVENDDCKTPLDIAFALKQNDIIEVLSKRNIEKAFEILENQEDQQSAETVNKLTFMEATFNYDYRIPLSKEDIQNILDFTYIRRNGENVFKTIETKEDIENEIEEFLRVKKKTTLIFKLVETCWITLVLYYTREDKCKAYFIYPRGKISSSDTSILELPDFIDEKVLDKGFEISDFQLEQHSNLYDSGIFSLKIADVFNSFSNENEVTEKLQSLELDIKKEREFYANILMEKRRVEDKIAVCLKTLQNLNKNKSNVDKLNHKNANVFINFLETFALRDTFPKMSEIWTQDEQDQNKKTLTDLKKAYFTTYYFETKSNQDQKSDFSLIRSARKVLHASKIMQPEDFECFMKDKSSISNFFKNLELYTENIKDKIDNNLKNSINDIPCHSFLTFQKHIGNQSKGDFLSILRKFLLDIYMPENKIDQEKIIFDVTVNIIPVIDENKEKVRSLKITRNNLVHNYQEKSILNNEKKFKEIKELHFLRSDLLKYFYSKEVHKLLSKILDKNIETLQDEFQKILEDFQKEIVKEENISLISGEHSKSFEYIFQESLFPESDENISNLVDKYLKYAFMVEKKTGAKVVHIDDDEEEEEIKYNKLTDDKRREIFEDFMKLKKTKELTPAEIQYEINVRNELKEKLKMYGLEVSYFDRILKHYLDDANELSEESIKKRDKIIGILDDLKQIKKDFSLSSKTIINLYEKLLELKQKGITNLRQCGSILDEELNNSKLTENQKESQKSAILRRLRNFPGMETIDIMTGSVKITELNTFDIIKNVLSAFYSSYDTYKIKFDNVEEAFNDDILLDYLVNLNLEQKNDSKILKDKYFVFAIVKKLITMEYASPYIVKLLTESNDDTVIDKKDFIHLLGTVLKNKAYVKHLKKLLNFKSEKFDVYGEFCKQILDNNFSIESIGDILQDYNHVNAILNKLDAMIQNIKSNHLMEKEASKVEEFCNKILNKDFNIENMHNIRQDYNDVKVILSKLSAKIENVNVEQPFENDLKKIIEFCENNFFCTSFDDTNVQDEFKNHIKEILSDLNIKVRSRETNYQKEKNVKTIEETTQQILKQLDIITYKLHCDNRYDDVVKILEASIEASKKLIQNDDLKNILLKAEFQKAKSIIQLAIIEKKKSIKKKKINEALRILHQIEDKQETNPVFLLISSEIAYAERLLKEYNRSYNSYRRLYDRISFNISKNDFSKLENSKEYQKMLTFSDDAKNYLNFASIRISMACTKIFRGWEFKNNNQKALHSHEEALKILEELYSFLRRSLKNSSDNENGLVILGIVPKIVCTKISIGEIFMKQKKYRHSLQYFQEALVKRIQYNNELRKVYTDFHTKFEQNKHQMAKVLGHISAAYFHCASIEFDEFRSKRMTDCNKVRKLKNIQLMYEEAEKISKKLLSIPSYSKSEKTRINSLLKVGKNRIHEIEQEIKKITAM